MREKQMREIKFRGKHEGKYNTYFVEGFGINKRPDGLIFIINKEDGMWYEVDCNTLGQYTGLKDKNGKEIYEGDVVKLKKIEIVSRDYIPPYDYEIIKEKGKLKTIASYETLIAEYDTRENAFRYKYKKNGHFATLIDCEIEIIGNVWDDPELLEK